jgi:hypothetical protein
MSIWNNAQEPDLLVLEIQGLVVMMSGCIRREVGVVKIRSAIRVFLKKVRIAKTVKHGSL